MRDKVGVSDVAVRRNGSDPGTFLKGLCGGKRVLPFAPTVAQPRASPSKSVTGVFLLAADPQSGLADGR